MASNTSRGRVAVIGASGYGGGELLRRLLVHPEVDVVHAVAPELAGQPLWAAHPKFEGRTDLRFVDLTPLQAALDVDLVFLAIPHSASLQVVPDIVEKTSARLIDLSGAFRLGDAMLYAKHQGSAHPRPDLLGGLFVYGLPEANREAIRGARCVASPGCFATAIELALLPWARNGRLGGEVSVVGITGSSGSGATPSPTTHHPVRAVNLRAYQPLSHPHLPEIVETLSNLGARADLSLGFVPVSAPLSRGILVVAQFVPTGPADERLSSAGAAAIVRETFVGEPFVRVPQARMPEVVAVAGSQYVEVSATVGAPASTFPHAADADVPQVVCAMAALDNLVKGGAGQAIQSMNLMFGFDERTTLGDVGGWP